jgi:hypothetical protein
LPARVPSISLKNQPLLFILVQPKGVGKIWSKPSILYSELSFDEGQYQLQHICDQLQLQFKTTI